MAPKKQPARNAFYYFMMDFKNKQGRKFSSLREVSEAASPHWNRMSRDQKQVYENKARLEKGREKFTSENLNVEELQQQEREEENKIEEMKENINRELKVAREYGKVQDKIFYIIHFNIFCQCTADNRYYPAEVAVVGFNLETGVQDVFHRIIKPGSLPLGYASIARLTSEQTHQIDPPLADAPENNIQEVFYDMKEFLKNQTAGSKKKLVVYSDEPKMKIVQSVLDTWCEDFGESPNFKVYNLQYMFRVLKNVVAEEEVWSSDTFSMREIEKDVYAYAKGISCEYHEVTNVPVHCSKSIATRYAYIICDNCCPDLNIQFIPGCHLPDTAFTEDSRPLSVASFVSSKTSRSKGNASTADLEDFCSNKSEWDNESLASATSSSTLNNEDFPTLSSKKKFSEASVFSQDTSSFYGSSSTKSYAGATGRLGLSKRPADMPSSIASGMEKLSLNTSKSEFFTNDQETSKNVVSGVNDFPALGRGRGPRGRGFRRPNNS